MVALVLAIVPSALGQKMLQVAQVMADRSRVAVSVLLKLTDDGEVIMTIITMLFRIVLLSIVVILCFLIVH